MKRKKILIIILIIVAGFGVFLRFGLPAVLHMAGLHPEYKGPKYTLSEGRALIIPVRECEVIRYVDLPTKGRYLFAVAFTRMDPAQEARLRELLYNEQRQMLRIRKQHQKG